MSFARLYCDTQLAGQEKWFLAGAGEARMHVEKTILKCICFLGLEDATETVDYGGTGFFVVVKSEMVPERVHAYLVTARHCVEEAEESVKEFCLRVNTKDGKSLTVSLQGASWFFLDEPEREKNTDVAILPFPRDSRFEMGVVPERMFALEEALEAAGEELTMGTDLLITGLFREHGGRTRNLPVVRTGMLSAFPDPEEPLTDMHGRTYEAYLAEIHSIGGLSGSPVFAAFNQIVMEHPPRSDSRFEIRPKLFLLGLIREHWTLTKRIESDQYLRTADALNMGMAAVTPVSCLSELLYQEDVVESRRKADREYLSKS